MNDVLNYLKNCGTYYLATVENNQPRVRPFGAVAELNSKLYMVTNNKKAVYNQLLENPKLEISAMKDNTWIRLEATAVIDDNRDARVKILADYPSLSGMYNPDDQVMTVFYLKDAKATVYAFGGEPVSYEF